MLDEAVGAARQAMADDPSAENIELFTDLQEKFQSNGGYEAESVMARLADGLGLRQELLLEDIESLSGGQRRRCLLYTSVVHGQLGDFERHHPRPRRGRQSELARLVPLVHVGALPLDALDAPIEGLGHLGPLGRLAAHGIGQGRKPGDLPLLQRGRALSLRLVGLVLRLELTKLAVHYGNNEVLSNVNFHVSRGDHIVIIGKNGAGKSSLLRCLAGVQEPTNGVIEFGANVALGYFAQEHEQIDPTVTTLDLSLIHI